MKFLKLILPAFLMILIFFTSCKKESMITPALNTEGNRTTNVDQAYIKTGSSVILYAGQTINAGTVDVNVVNTDLQVTFNAQNGFELLEAHLFVGESLSAMPLTKSGNPQIGNFPYKISGLSGVTTYTFTIPLSVFGSEPSICDKTYIVAAHASLRKQNSDGSYQNETGWGAGSRINTRGSWATYFNFTFGCQQIEPPVENCETAFGLSPYTFISYGLTTSRWGWVIEVDQPGTYTTPIYAAAGMNVINNGYYVGDLNYTYDGSTLIVTYNMFPGMKMSETHLYASNNIPTTIAPGQYGNIHQLSQSLTDQYVINNLTGKVYIIAHAVVCSSTFAGSKLK